MVGVQEAHGSWPAVRVFLTSGYRIPALNRSLGCKASFSASLPSFQHATRGASRNLRQNGVMQRSGRPSSRKWTWMPFNRGASVSSAIGATPQPQPQPHWLSFLACLTSHCPLPLWRAFYWTVLHSNFYCNRAMELIHALPKVA